MSGGAFNYQHRKIKEMADDLRGITTCERESGASCCPYGMNGFDGDCSFYIEATPHGKEAVAAAMLLLMLSARAAKAVEWWASGDIGEDDACREIATALADSIANVQTFLPRCVDGNQNAEPGS